MIITQALKLKENLSQASDSVLYSLDHSTLTSQPEVLRREGIHSQHIYYILHVLYMYYVLLLYYRFCNQLISNQFLLFCHYSSSSLVPSLSLNPGLFKKHGTD